MLAVQLSVQVVPHLGQGLLLPSDSWQQLVAVPVEVCAPEAVALVLDALPVAKSVPVAAGQVQVAAA